MASYDVASTIHQSLNIGAACGPGKELKDVSDDNYNQAMSLCNLVGVKAGELLTLSSRPTLSSVSSSSSYHSFSSFSSLFFLLFLLLILLLLLLFLLFLFLFLLLFLLLLSILLPCVCTCVYPHQIMMVSNALM